jgi:hypothetical protein
MTNNNNNIVIGIRPSPIISVDEFFDTAIETLAQSQSNIPDHTLEQSPCRSIIGTKHYTNQFGIVTIIYYCKLTHIYDFGPAAKGGGGRNRIKTDSIYLNLVEDHCRNYKPELHKQSIISNEIKKIGEEKRKREVSRIRSSSR